MVNNINKRSIIQLHNIMAWLKMNINSTYGNITNNSLRADETDIFYPYHQIKRKIVLIETRKQKIKKIFKND